LLTFFSYFWFFFTRYSIFDFWLMIFDWLATTKYQPINHKTNNIWFWFVWIIVNWFKNSWFNDSKIVKSLNFWIVESLNFSDNPRFIYSRIYFSTMSKNVFLFLGRWCLMTTDDQNLRAQRYCFFLSCKLFWKYFWSFFWNSCFPCTFVTVILTQIIYKNHYVRR